MLALGLTAACSDRDAVEPATHGASSSEGAGRGTPDSSSTGTGPVDGAPSTTAPDIAGLVTIEADLPGPTTLVWDYQPPPGSELLGMGGGEAAWSLPSGCSLSMYQSRLSSPGAIGDQEITEELNRRNLTEDGTDTQILAEGGVITVAVEGGPGLPDVTALELLGLSALGSIDGEDWTVTKVSRGMVAGDAWVTASLLCPDAAEVDGWAEISRLLREATLVPMEEPAR